MVKENTLLKVKNFLGNEVEIIGFKEKLTNTNDQTENIFGRNEAPTRRME